MKDFKKLIIAVGVILVAYGLYGVVAAWMAIRPWHLPPAVKEGDLGKVRLILAVHPGWLNRPHGDDGWTALHHAADAVNLEMARYLLDKGANVNQQDAYGRTSLHVVCRELKEEDSLPMLDLLVEHGADIQVADALERQPIHYAALTWEEGIEALVSHGADPNARTGTGGTTLHEAVVTLVEPMRVLLEHGADPNARDDRGWTALHEAAALADVDAAAVLVQNGADPRIAGKLGLIPIDVARTIGADEVVRYLEDHRKPSIQAAPVRQLLRPIQHERLSLAG